MGQTPEQPRCKADIKFLTVYSPTASLQGIKEPVVEGLQASLDRHPFKSMEPVGRRMIFDCSTCGVFGQMEMRAGNLDTDEGKLRSRAGDMVEDNCEIFRREMQGKKPTRDFHPKLP